VWQHRTQREPGAMRAASWILALCCSSASALVVSPSAVRRGAVAVLPAARAAIVMQVEAPIKVPDKVPDFAPANPDQQKAPQKGKKWKLLLFNDNVNKREYVARVLVSSVPDFSQADAYKVMQKAHQNGMAVVGVWVFEVAEAYCDKLKQGGLIASVTEEDD